MTDKELWNAVFPRTFTVYANGYFQGTFTNEETAKDLAKRLEYQGFCRVRVSKSVGYPVQYGIATKGDYLNTYNEYERETQENRWKSPDN